MTEDEKLKLKNQILTELFIGGELQRKIAGMAWRNRVHKDTHLEEDFVQEAFMWLSSKSADYILELHNDNPRRLVGLGVTIAIYKCFSRNSKNRNYPKHSALTYWLFASNLTSMQTLSPTEDCDDDGEAFGRVLVDESTLPKDEDDFDVWKLIRANLNEEELKTLDYHLTLKRGPGQFSNEVKFKYNKLVKRIEEIINQNNINL